jgi:asparagine synthase (glutamine-hydrolysing)
MCGIAGLSLVRGEADQRVLDDMAARLAHRGPDDRGSWRDGPVGLAHTRLSIIDVAGGHQPLTGAADGLVLIANGEIYNHVELRAEHEARGRRFRTRSDCEAILHTYALDGLDGLKRLHGMFAFALYDRAARRLVLARDRLGIKPLFLARIGDGIAFASELKALRGLVGAAPALDPRGLLEFLQNQFTTGATTVLADVERVLPGEIVCIEDGRMTERRRYWSPLDVQPLDTDFDGAAERFDALMERVMREHMRTDVPFGLFLSGGVDSAVLLALLTRYGDAPVRSLSLGFPGSSVRDELPTAMDLAPRFDSRHTLIEARAEAMLELMPRAVWAADELMQDYANLPTLALAEVAGAELKVVFTGEGGDEVFAGYGRYRMSALERGVRALAAPGSGGFRTRGVFRGPWPRRLFGERLRSAGAQWRDPFTSAWRDTPRDWGAVRRMQCVDLATALPDNLLVKVDRMLMACGVEGRVPFLDHRVVEFGLALPDGLKIADGQGKVFLKRWAERHLPKEALWRRKRGFHVPVGDWMRGALLDRLEPALAAHPAVREWFRPHAVGRLAAAQRSSGKATRALWTVFQFALWYTLFVEGDAAPPPRRIDPLDVIS